jgi:hypothetical protein
MSGIFRIIAYLSTFERIIVLGISMYRKAKIYREMNRLGIDTWDY